jgi:hypothetical protein
MSYCHDLLSLDPLLTQRVLSNISLSFAKGPERVGFSHQDDLLMSPTAWPPFPDHLLTQPIRARGSGFFTDLQSRNAGELIPGSTFDIKEMPESHDRLPNINT